MAPIISINHIFAPLDLLCKEYVNLDLTETKFVFGNVLYTSNQLSPTQLITLEPVKPYYNFFEWSVAGTNY